MTEKRFRLELMFKAEIETEELNTEDYGDQRCIKQFIQAFAQHPDAVSSHFKQLLMDMILSDDDKNTIAKLLNVRNDDRHLLDVTASCSDDVKHFIHDLYSTGSGASWDENTRERLIREIEDRLGKLSVTNAEFTLLNPQNAVDAGNR